MYPQMNFACNVAHFGVGVGGGVVEKLLYAEF